MALKSVKAYAPHSPKGFTALFQNFASANDPAGYAGLLRVDFHCRVIFKWHANTCKIEVLYGRSRVNVKLEPRSTFTFSRGKSYINTCLVPRRLSFDENVRAKEGGKELPMVPCGSSPVTRFALASTL